MSSSSAWLAGTIASTLISACGQLEPTEDVFPPSRGQEDAPASAPRPGAFGVAEGELPTSPRGVSPHDLAILYPLPDGDDEPVLLRGEDIGAEGPLLPRVAFDLLFPAGRTDSEKPSTYGALALVAVRVDPCYARRSSCDPQVRAVFQGLSRDPSTRQWRVADGAVHVKYRVSHDELRAIVAKLVAAQPEALEGPLGPNPLLGPGGREGLVATHRALWLASLGETKILSVTGYDHVAVSATMHRFTFAKVEHDRGSFVASRIPTTNAFTEVVHGSSPCEPLASSSAELEIEPERDSVTALVGPRRAPPGKASEVLEKTFAASTRVVDPMVHDESTTTCANCHLAEGARTVAAHAYASPRRPGPLARTDVRSSVTNLHAFGYLDRDPAIAERTGAEVLVSLRAFFPGGEK